MSLSGRWLPLFLVILSGTLALVPVLSIGIPFNNDLANHYHFVLPFYDAIAGGDIYPGWLSTSNQGYGDPLFRFYPPSLYYLLALARRVTGDWYAASLSVFTLLSLLGALGAYFWASCFLPRHIAAWAGVLYAFMPYRVAELYQAAQIAEFAAGVTVLFVLAFTTRICQRESWLNVGGLAASYGLLILTHLPIAVFASITLLIYALLCLKGHHKLRTLVKLFCGAVLGLFASAFYWITVLTEMKWIVGDGVNPDPLLDYRYNFIFSTFSPEKNNTIWWMNILMLFTLLMCVPAVSLFSEKLHLPSRREIISVAFVLFFTLLMATPISKPLWDVIPMLQKTQHPFRWLAVTSVVVPLLIAASIPWWWKTFQGKYRSIALALAGLVFISVTFVISQIIRPARYLSRSEFAQIITPLRESSSIVQWLPVWAMGAAQGKRSYEKIPPLRDSALVEAGERSTSVISWEPLHRLFKVDSGKPIEARIRTLYYPHWVATANGKLLPARADHDGVLLISVPEPSVTVSLEFQEPASTRVAAIVSGISWTLLGSLFIFGRLKRTRPNAT